MVPGTRELSVNDHVIEYLQTLICYFDQINSSMVDRVGRIGKVAVFAILHEMPHGSSTTAGAGSFLVQISCQTQRTWLRYQIDYV